MALSILLRNNFISKFPKLSIATARGIHNLHKIGDREIVGYGRNGSTVYYDHSVYPMPGIRWKADTPEITELRNLERGCWTKLSIEDKKALYRSSFRQTFAEFQAPTGQWKWIIGVTMYFIGLGILMQVFLWKFVYSPLPESMQPENEKAQLIRMLLLMTNPVHGIAAKWDYENWKWKDDQSIYFNKK